MKNVRLVTLLTFPIALGCGAPATENVAPVEKEVLSSQAPVAGASDDGQFRIQALRTEAFDEEGEAYPITVYYGQVAKDRALKVAETLRIHKVKPEERKPAPSMTDEDILDWVLETREENFVHVAFDDLEDGEPRPGWSASLSYSASRKVSPALTNYNYDVSGSSIECEGIFFCSTGAQNTNTSTLTLPSGGTGIVTLYRHTDAISRCNGAWTGYDAFDDDIYQTSDVDVQILTSSSFGVYEVTNETVSASTTIGYGDFFCR